MFADVVGEFAEFDQSSPNCVVLGDANEAFTYQRLNTAFQLLLENPGTKLIMMGHGFVIYLLFVHVSELEETLLDLEHLDLP